MEDFVDKVNAYVARLAKKCQKKSEEYDYEPNEETKEAMREAQEHISAHKRGEDWATKGAIDTSSVEAMLKSSLSANNFAQKAFDAADKIFLSS